MEPKERFGSSFFAVMLPGFLLVETLTGRSLFGIGRVTGRFTCGIDLGTLLPEFYPWRSRVLVPLSCIEDALQLVVTERPDLSVDVTVGADTIEVMCLNVIDDTDYEAQEAQLKKMLGAPDNTLFAPYKSLFVTCGCPFATFECPSKAYGCASVSYERRILRDS